jgi:hypothetical protein
LGRQVALALAAGLCVTAAVAIWALIRGHFDVTEARILGSTLTASLLTLTGLVGATVLDRTDLRRALGQVTILLSAIDLGLTLAAIWSQPVSEAVARGLGMTSILLPACVHACLVLGRLRHGDSRVVRALSSVTVSCATLAAAAGAGAIALGSGPVEPAFWRLLGVLVVLAVLTSLLVPIPGASNAAETMAPCSRPRTPTAPRQPPVANPRGTR